MTLLKGAVYVVCVWVNFIFTRSDILNLWTQFIVTAGEVNMSFMKSFTAETFSENG